MALFAKDLKIAKVNWLNAAGKVSKERAQELVGYDTGTLHDAHTYEIKGDDTAIVGYHVEPLIAEAGVNYGPFHFYGTRPHKIEATNAQSLRFEIGGQAVFATSVNHPGTKPNRWLENVKLTDLKELYVI